MKHALIAASVAALVAGVGWASAQGLNERPKAPAAAPEQHNPIAPRTPETAKPAPTAQAPETTAQSSSRAAAVGASAEEEWKSAAEARRVRAAVSRTLERMQVLSRMSSD
jgi:hypothetical protein